MNTANWTPEMLHVAQHRVHLKKMLKMAESLSEGRPERDPTIDAVIAQIKVELLYHKLWLNAHYPLKETGV